MSNIKKLLQPVLLTTALFFFSCSTKQMIKSAPLNSGTFRNYKADKTAVLQAALNALKETDIDIIEVHGDLGGYWMVMAENNPLIGRPANLRLVGKMNNDSVTTVYLLSKHQRTEMIDYDFSDDIFPGITKYLGKMPFISKETKKTEKIITPPADIRKTSLAVLTLNARDVSHTDALTLTNRLITELFNSGYFTVMERQKMEQILAERNFLMENCTSSECMTEAARLLNVEAVVSGTIYKSQHVYSLCLQLVDVGSSEIKAVVFEDIEGDLGLVLVQGIKNVVRKLLDHI